MSDIFNIFTKYILLSSLNSPLDMPEVIGKLVFNYPLIEFLSSSLDVDLLNNNVYTFISESSTEKNIFKFFSSIDKSKFIFLSGKILEYRLNTTFFRFFSTYSKFLNYKTLIFSNLIL